MLQICVKHIYIMTLQNLVYGGGEMRKTSNVIILKFDAKTGEVEFECNPVNWGAHGSSLGILLPASIREPFRDKRVHVRIKVIGEEK